MGNQIKVNVNLDTKAVDQVELTNDRPETLRSFTKLRDIIDVFGKQVKRRLSGGQVNGNGKQRKQAR